MTVEVMRLRGIIEGGWCPFFAVWVLLHQHTNETGMSFP